MLYSNHKGRDYKQLKIKHMTNNTRTALFISKEARDMLRELADKNLRSMAKQCELLIKQAYEDGRDNRDNKSDSRREDSR